MHGFNNVADAYGQSVKSGIGTARVLLPDSLRKTVEKFFEGSEFAASTPSGSFSSESLAHLLESSSWADIVLLAGDFGNNSETVTMLEKFISKYAGQLVIAGDSLDFFYTQPELLLNRPLTTLVLDFNQLQKLITSAKFLLALTSTMDLLHVVELLHEFNLKHPLSNLVLASEGLVYVASSGEVSSTKLNAESDRQQNYAAMAAVWWTQNPNKTFAALSSSLI